MKQQTNRIIENQNGLSQHNTSSKKQLIRLRNQLSSMMIPFDFTGDEPSDDPFWAVIKLLMQQGYLTEDLKPTTLSLDKGYIIYNDGSKQFEGLEKQPELLMSLKFLLKKGKKLVPDFDNFFN